MALISYVDDAIYKDRLQSAQVANLLGAIFHSPEWAEAFVRLAGTQMSDLALAAGHRELVILQTGYMLKADYVVAQHEDVSELLGVSRAQREALSGRRFEDPVFNEREKALLRFGASLVQRTYSNEDVLEQAKVFFSERELVEIVGVQGLAATVAAITLTFRVDVDPVGGEELLRFARLVAAK